MKPIQYAHISSAGTQTLTSAGNGQLWTVNVNTTSAGSLTLYDGQSASGKVIAVIDTSNPVSRGYAVVYKLGITAVLVGSADVTVGFE